MNKLIKRTLIIVVALEFLYLALFNLALNISLTQDIINRIKPEKFSVSWDQAWTWYPLSVHAKGISANGQSAGQQWQVDSTEASGSVSLLPLVLKKVQVNHAEARDVTYHQRPRPSPDKSYENIREYFPPIEGRDLVDRPEPSPGNSSAKKKKSSWEIRVQDIQVSGNHNLWLFQVQAGIRGHAQADVSFETRGGPLSVSNGVFDISLDSLKLDGDREVTSEGLLKGEVEIRPFKPKENRGIKALEFVKIDANIETNVQSLAFLNPYLKNFQGMKIDGTGELAGHIRLDQGVLEAGSKLSVEADELTLDIFNYLVEGQGDIEITVPEPGKESHITIEFGKLSALTLPDRIPLLEGEGLSVKATGTPKILPPEGDEALASYLGVSIPSLKVPDIGNYQRFLPDSWPFKLHGGEGALQGKAELSHEFLNADIQLQSASADVGFKDLRFSSDLDTRIKLDSPSLESGQIDISGTYLALEGAKLSNEETESAAWFANINVEKGIVSLNLDEAEEGASGAKHLMRSLKDSEIKTLFASADEELVVTGKISDLNWLNLLLNSPFGLVISGGGKVSADVEISGGHLDEGTRITVDPDELIVDVLDYRASGRGGVELEVVRGGEKPDLALMVAVNEAQFGRKDEDQAFVENVDITLEVLARSMDLDSQDHDVELRLRIPSARVSDMSVFNSYIPASSSLAVLGGEASLDVDILLKPDDADGYVRLVTENMRSRLDEQEISGDLTADITLVGGVPKNMEFDISGSSLKLDGVRVAGTEESFHDEDWAAQFELTRAQAVWKKPIQLDLEADLQLSDSKPLVSIISNKRGKHGWLGDAMTIDDVVGDARMQIKDGLIIIPYAFVGSDNVDVGVKAVLGEKGSNNGMIFVRYKKLKALLQTTEGDHNLDVINTEQQFEEYSVDSILNPDK